MCKWTPRESKPAEPKVAATLDAWYLNFWNRHRGYVFHAKLFTQKTYIIRRERLKPAMRLLLFYNDAVTQPIFPDPEKTMKHHIHSTIVLVLVTAGIVWAANVPFDNQSLTFCVSSYREGYYQKTIDCIREVMPALKTNSDSVAAFKFLGLSYGMLNQIETSKQYFKQAMDKDPFFEIDTLEFPPNITIIYNQVKLEKKMARLDSTSEEVKSVPAEGKQDIVMPTVYLSTTVIAAGAAGYFFYKSYAAYQKYLDEEQQDRMDSYYSDHRNALIAGVCCSAVVPVTLYLFLRKTASYKNVGLIGENGQVFLTWSF
jgi:tetratricopeptide (TPR) repeat protein